MHLFTSPPNPFRSKLNPLGDFLNRFRSDANRFGCRLNPLRLGLNLFYETGDVLSRWLRK